MSKRSIVICLRTIISLFFLVSFLKGIGSFQVDFIKFSMIDFVYNLKIGKVYYLLYGLKLFFGIFVFLTGKSANRIVFEGLLVFYFSLIVTFLIYMNCFYNGCIDCSYHLAFFNENFQSTLFFTFGIVILYMVSMTLSK